MNAINRTQLIERIKEIEGLSNDERASLLELLRTTPKYGLVWENKPEDVEQQLEDELPVLTEVKDRAIISDAEDAPNHILIEGDNLHALTALTYTHEGKIDVIYIDPPYNTGNKDFKYNDSFVDREDGYRHSKWLSFMAKRLRIAKRLLSDKGVIFISIDDNEQAQLKLLCDEIFGNLNFIGSICRQAIKGGSKSSFIRQLHDYVLIYSNSKETVGEFTGIAKEELELDLVDEKGPYTKGRELNKWGAGSRREDSPSMWFPIEGPNGVEVYPIRNDGSEGRWRWGKKKLLQAVKDGDVIFEMRDNGTYIAYEKVRGLKTPTKQFTSWFGDNYLNAKGSESLKSIFNTLMSVFDYAKPVELIHDLVFMSSTKDSIVLDFFAGSGTTLQATMQLNSEDEGNRRCIIVTNNDGGICEQITYERNKRVIQGYTTPKGVEVPGLTDNNLRYYRTDFVPREKTQKNMRALVVAATDMLCIKNNIYTETGELCGAKMRPSLARHFKDANGEMLIIYDDRAIPAIVAKLKDLAVSQKIKVYVFSPNEYPYTDEFFDVTDKVELCALPAAIYDAYRKVLKKPKPRFFDSEQRTVDSEQSETEEKLGGMFDLLEE